MVNCVEETRSQAYSPLHPVQIKDDRLEHARGVEPRYPASNITAAFPLSCSAESGGHRRVGSPFHGAARN